MNLPVCPTGVKFTLLYSPPPSLHAETYIPADLSLSAIQPDETQSTLKFMCHETSEDNNCRLLDRIFSVSFRFSCFSEPESSPVSFSNETIDSSSGSGCF